MSFPALTTDLGAYVADIVTAYVSNHTVAAPALPELIQSVQGALNRLGSGAARDVPRERATPAVPIKRSIFPDYLICLEDGKKLKMLKRHLKVSYGMEPADYRAKWGLSPDYPMTAPRYAERRSSLAKQNGLGRQPRTVAEVAVPSGPVVQQIPEVQREPKRSKAVNTRDDT
jgi:predicted transcriptional regulator